MQYEQKLLHPYMMETHAFTPFSRTVGIPSAMLPRSSATEKTRFRLSYTCHKSSGKRHRAWGPNTRSTWR